MSVDHLPKVLGIFTSIVTGAFLFRLFFDNCKDFRGCVGYALKSDFLSWINKELHRDYAKSMKLGMFGLMAAVHGYFAYIVVRTSLNQT